MKRVPLSLTVLLCIVFTFCSCNAKSVNANVASTIVVSSETASTGASAAEYSTDPQALLGYWNPAFYSYDNENYTDYLKTHGEEAVFIFYPNNTLIVRHSDQEEYMVTYITSEERPGTIDFYDYETGKATDCVAGFGVIMGEHGSEKLVLSVYNTEDVKFTYIMLDKIYNTEI